MSEYRYYEFLAIDRPLDDDEQADVRSLSTRADITATRFVNEYHWGDFKGDPKQLVERFYDAHLYVANWGTHRVMFRLPCDLLDPEVVDDYLVDGQVGVWTADGFTIIDFTSEDETGEFDLDYMADTLLSAIVGVRAELAGGDLRSLYLAWLAAYGAWERDEDVFDRAADDEREPPVPPGLGTLTGAQRALADFLRVDDDLLAVAAVASAPLDETGEDPAELAAWVARLPVAEKNQLLMRVVQGDPPRVRIELLRRFRGDAASTTVPVLTRRTVADLLDETARRRDDRQRRLAAQRAQDKARRERERVLDRARRLDELATEGDAAWSRVDTLIATRKPADYDAAVALLVDLRALAEREGRSDTFASRANGLRQAHGRKPSLIERFDRAGI